ncbi:CLUMA_CG020649, isoform A [Clunio marinus]|uniref:CLUMA_CG020649, isoform A n=1 Tax=Clunio marinus TaxID=568069 RepID=A0A1J1J7D7_9DIPT|nr:CLUMA_CG020649, isoform A [Clunio marinus]
MLILGKKFNNYHPLKKQQNQHTDISQLLDKLLENYQDNSLRPNFGGLPAVVEIDLMVRSMGPVSEIEMYLDKRLTAWIATSGKILSSHHFAFNLDIIKIFHKQRQTWIDRRLAFEDSSHNVSTLALSISMLKKIWKPDTYFFNGKQSYLHTITTPNKFVRLYKDGRVLYSSRLTIKAACPMNLENFPMDVQRCPLKLGSFGYTTSDVLYRWNSRAVAISDDLRMSQFDLIDVPSSNQSISVGKNEKSIALQEYSVLLVSFHLQRHMGNFLIQVYGPCILLVVLSWVSFWLNREATADRVSLGITTVLTMTFLGLEARTDLPKVSYPTALDFFVFLSFAFIFATILQFAVVHYFTKYGSGECYFNFYEESSSDSESEDEEIAYYGKDSTMPTSQLSSMTHVNSADMYGVIPLSRLELNLNDQKKHFKFMRRFRKFLEIYFPCSFNSKRNENAEETSVTDDESIAQCEQQIDSNASTITHNTPKCRRHSSQNMKQPRGFRRNFNSVSKIDKFSRVVFPLLFFIINLLYWIFYLTRSQRK